MNWLQYFTPEIIAGGIVGFSLLGLVIRNAILGWSEARSKMRASESGVAGMATALSVSWDRDQIERFLQTMERIAEAIEIQGQHTAVVAKAQGVLADQFQQTTHQKLNELLEKLEQVPTPPRRR